MRTFPSPVNLWMHLQTDNMEDTRPRFNPQPRQVLDDLKLLNLDFERLVRDG